MYDIQCIYCGKTYNKIKDTELIRDKQYVEDSQVRRLNCKKCKKQHIFLND